MNSSGDDHTQSFVDKNETTMITNEPCTNINLNCSNDCLKPHSVQYIYFSNLRFLSFEVSNIARTKAGLHRLFMENENKMNENSEIVKLAIPITKNSNLV